MRVQSETRRCNYEINYRKERARIGRNKMDCCIPRWSPWLRSRTVTSVDEKVCVYYRGICDHQAVLCGFVLKLATFYQTQHTGFNCEGVKK